VETPPPKKKVTVLGGHMQDVANSLRTIRTELAETANEMLIENISLLNDKLDAAG